MAEGKRLILLGDRTSHGGTVVSAQSMMTIDGIPVATIGDKVTCPKCKGTHVIISGGGNIRLMGRELAREGDRVSCGASLVSVQQSRSTHSSWAPPAPKPVPSMGRSYSEEEAAVLAAQTPLDHPRVMALAGSSKTLSKQLENARGKADIGYINGNIGYRNGNIIRISKGTSDKEQVRHLSHEIGHYYGGVHADTGMEKSEFLNAKMEDEGAATLNTLRVRDEIITKKGQTLESDIGVTTNNNNTGEYEKIYSRLKAGEITESDARRQIGEIYRSGEHLYDNKVGDYVTYEEWYGKQWDSVNPGRVVK